MKLKSPSSSPVPDLAGRPRRGLPSFEFLTPTRVVFGVGSLNRLGELTQELGGNRVLVVTDPGLETAGHPQRAVASLAEAGLQAFVFDQVEENPTTRHVNQGTTFAQKHDIDFLVAVGGGSAMDCAKGINFLLTNGGTMADYRGYGKATEPMLPSISIPTTAGTGIENSMLGACHACANPLTAHYGLTHGLAIGIMLPHVIRFNAEVVGDLYGELAGEAGLLDGDRSVAAEALAKRIISLMETAGLPTTLSACGISLGIFPVFADEAGEQWIGLVNRV